MSLYQAQGQYGWMMWHAQVKKSDWRIVTIMAGVSIIVVMLKMSGLFAVMNQKVIH